jgi:GTP-binding protein EngB required for normal cell division
LVRFRGIYERLQQEHLQIAVVGQFKRGKSSFINALLGAALLPTAVIPLTAIATFISWRPEPLVRIHFKGSRATEEHSAQDPDSIQKILFRYVAEEANPHNCLNVDRVELFYPAPILTGGIVLIDTPGIGSTLLHNTETAFQLLSECDAAIFVVSADPPITEIEREYLKRVSARADRLFLVLNKIDYLAPGEQKTAVQFLRKVLIDNSLAVETTSIFCVSSRRGLAAKLEANRVELDNSGIPDIEDHLVRSLASEKHRILANAVQSQALEILSLAVSEVELRIRALELPLSELSLRAQSFENALRSIEEQRRVVRDLLAGDQRRLRENLEARIENVRQEATGELTRVIDQNLADTSAQSWHTIARQALSKTLESRFDQARENLVGAFSRETDEVLSVHQQRIETLVGSVRQAAAQIFDISLGSETGGALFRLHHEPYWVTENLGASLIPDLHRLLDGLLPVWLRRRRIRARLKHLAQELVLRNAENLRWAILRGIDETCRAAALHFEDRLDEAIAATRGVIARVLAQRKDQTGRVEPEIERLMEVKQALEAMRRELASA